MQNFQLQLQIYQDNLSPREQALARYLTEHQAAASQWSISELSKRTKISTATISRFAKNLGYANFQNLRVALAQSQDQASQLFAEISPQDDLITMAGKIFSSNIEALQATQANLTPESLRLAVTYIINCQHLGIYGLGASNIVALDGYHKFLRTAIEVLYAADYHMQLMSMTHLTAKDATIVVSHSGEDKDALSLAKIAKDNGVPLIAITSSPSSHLAKMADVYFVSVAEESKYRTEALHALIAQISIMDTLFMLSAVKTDSQTAPLFQEIRKQIEQTRE
ncbi:MAG: MurR/RpiR family transcriptional regulator [Lactobacillus sp.]|jgi:DNA-binding MurR/RpiR family transcriptional regulator|nr:MurR/RpiR family transcriptional regulator [Lactobacillus sp.]